MGGALTEDGGPSADGVQGTGGGFVTSSVAMKLMAKMGHVEGQVREDALGEILRGGIIRAFQSCDYVAFPGLELLGNVYLSASWTLACSPVLISNGFHVGQIYVLLIQPCPPLCRRSPQGLGLQGQGINKAIEVVGGRRRAGLGMNTQGGEVRSILD